MTDAVMTGARPLNPRRMTLRASGSRRRGLTLVEVLATIMLMAIVLPVAMHGISLCMAAASLARQKTEAAGLAESKLNEMIATGDWQFGGASGDFGQAWPEFHWASMSGDWSADPTLKQVSVRVYWNARGEEREVVLTTLMYQSSTTTAAL